MVVQQGLSQASEDLVAPSDGAVVCYEGFGDPTASAGEMPLAEG